MLIISATNPCHMFDLANACSHLVSDVVYLSGYPTWKLSGTGADLQIQTFPLRTLVTYCLLKYVNPAFRPDSAALFCWQDRHFDKQVSGFIQKFSRPSSIHAMPGQCLKTFEQAKKQGFVTVLSHPTGPVEVQLEVIREEYVRCGLPLPDLSRHARYFLSVERREFELADYHCVASGLVRKQLLAKGVEPDKIWVVPYGAVPSLWRGGARADEIAKSDDGCFRIVMAAQLSLRKGLRFLLEALEVAGDKNWSLDVFGGLMPETEADRNRYRGTIPVRYHGAVSQKILADEFGKADIMVLPSLEEGFGLVVPQALSCGTPCIVSDRVGAQDLVVEGENGSVFRSGDVQDLVGKLTYWSRRRTRVIKQYPWAEPAKILLDYTREALMGDR